MNPQYYLFCSSIVVALLLGCSAPDAKNQIEDKTGSSVPKAKDHKGQVVNVTGNQGTTQLVEIITDWESVVFEAIVTEANGADAAAQVKADEIRLTLFQQVQIINGNEAKKGFSIPLEHEESQKSQSSKFIYKKDYKEITERVELLFKERNAIDCRFSYELETGEQMAADFTLTKPGIDPVKADAQREVITMSRKQIERTMDRNSLKQIALAIHNFYDVHRRMPMEVTGNELSWRVLLIPLLENGAFFKYLQNKSGKLRIDKKWVESDAKRHFSLSNENLVCGIKHLDQPKETEDFRVKMVDRIVLIENPGVDGSKWTEKNDLSVEETVKLIESIEPGEFLIGLKLSGETIDISSPADSKLNSKQIEKLILGTKEK